MQYTEDDDTPAASVPDERELTPVQRGALVMFHLMHGEGLRTRDVARITGLKVRSAFDLLIAMSLSVPIYEDAGVWVMCIERETEEKPAAFVRAAVIEGEVLGLTRLYRAGAVSAQYTVAECDRLLATGHCPDDLRLKLAGLRTQARNNWQT